MNTRAGVPLLDLQAQYQTIRSEVRAAVDRVLESQHFILGPEVEALESELAAYCQCKYAVGVSSGTDAILIALMALGIGPGDEVIMPPYTFFATAGCVARVGAKPVFVDIDPQTYNLDVGRLEQAVTPRSRAIIPVHLFGQIAEMDELMAIANRHELYVIEDAAQAIGSEYKRQRAGAIGLMGCFSFYPSKNLGGIGDGGLVTTNDADLAARLRLLRGHGAQPKYFHKEIGGNFRLDAIQAAVLRVKLKYLDSWTAVRQQNADMYRRLFAKKATTISLPCEALDRRHIYNQFIVRSQTRDALAKYLKHNNIGTEVYYPLPLHLQECFASLKYQTGDFPESERASAETLALPIYPEMGETNLKLVVDLVAAFNSQQANAPAEGSVLSITT